MKVYLIKMQYINNQQILIFLNFYFFKKYYNFSYYKLYFIFNFNGFLCLTGVIALFFNKRASLFKSFSFNLYFFFKDRRVFFSKNVIALFNLIVCAFSLCSINNKFSYIGFNVHAPFKNITSSPQLSTINTVFSEDMLNFNIFSRIDINLFFLDLERITNLNIIICYNYIIELEFVVALLAVRTILIRRYRFLWEQHDINIYNFLNNMLLSFKVKDVDLLLEIINGVFKDKYFANFRLYFNFIAKVIKSLWVHLVKFYDMRGLKIILKGKVGRRLLTRKHTLIISHGMISSTTIANSCVYRYNTIGSESGVFGLTIFFYYKSLKYN